MEERINGTMIITHIDFVLKYKERATRPEKQKKLRILKKKSTPKPAADHPWKKLLNKRWERNSWMWAS